MKYTILAGLLLAGCGSAVVVPKLGGGTGAPAAGPDTCNAAVHQGLIGMDAASALALPEPKRLAGPNDAVTTDFNPSRLNVSLDGTDTIVGISCG